MHLKPLYYGCRFNRSVILKTLLIMKFTFIFLTVCFLHAGAAGLSQTLTLKFTNAPLNEVFRAIEKQSDYSFVYGKEQLLTARRVNLNLTKVSVENALPEIFKDQPLEYTISGKAPSNAEGEGSSANGSARTKRPCSTTAVNAPQWQRDGNR